MLSSAVKAAFKPACPDISKHKSRKLLGIGDKTVSSGAKSEACSGKFQEVLQLPRTVIGRSNHLTQICYDTLAALRFKDVKELLATHNVALFFGPKLTASGLFSIGIRISTECQPRSDHRNRSVTRALPNLLVHSLMVLINPRQHRKPNV